MKAHARVLDALARVGAEASPLVGRELRVARMRWRERYAQATFRRTGRWVRDGFDWHVFSFGDVPARRGDAARRAYAAVTSPQVVLLSDGPSHHGFGLAATLATPPWPCFDGIDVLVIDSAYTWTMAFTHESELGPYFADDVA